MGAEEQVHGFPVYRFAYRDRQGRDKFRARGGNVRTGANVFKQKGLDLMRAHAARIKTLIYNVAPYLGRDVIAIISGSICMQMARRL